MPNISKRIFNTIIISILTISAHAKQEFFRVSANTPTKITTITPSGWMSWSNAVIPGTATVERSMNIANSNTWHSYIQRQVTSTVTSVRFLDNNTPDNMAYIPAGIFSMGDSFTEGLAWELPVHTVYISEFYMDKYEITKPIWDDVALWASTHGYDIPTNGLSKSINTPMHNATWYDCVKWCNARSEKEGMIPAYYTSAATSTIYRTGELDIKNSWVLWNSGYRLPTEAEWEKAARGGTASMRFTWSDTNTIQHARANYFSRFNESYDTSPTRGYHPVYNNGNNPYTSPVGTFAPNNYGIYDMTGNLAEWCWDAEDWQETYYNNSPRENPHGPVVDDVYRMIRGGEWSSFSDIARVASRDSGDASINDTFIIGLRTVLPLPVNP